MGGDVDCHLGLSTYPQEESSFLWAIIHRCALAHSPNTTVPSSISKGCMVTGQLTLCGVESTGYAIYVVCTGQLPCDDDWPAVGSSGLDS